MQFLSIKIYDQERKLNNNKLSRSFFVLFCFYVLKRPLKEDSKYSIWDDVAALMAAQSSGLEFAGQPVEH